MSKEFWNRENTVKLIQLYESHKLLWDNGNSDYRDKCKRKDAYASIAAELGVNVEDVNKKLESLMVQYRRERRSGTGTSERKVWWGLPYFKFLIDKYSRSSMPNMNMTQQAIVEFAEPLSDNGSGFSSDTPSPMGSTSSISSRPKLFTPKQDRNSKRGAKRRRTDDAFHLVETCYDDIQQEQKLTKDDHSVYVEYVASRIRKIKNPMIQCMVKNKIDNVIFEAEMEDLKEQGNKL
ncbi:uncharacterized protein LOC128985924 [Macrosteles quadrilineatus]|uniref:uncharacterized protein LOC128985924 n=1 Tax=Macrosteles quadrilineatus TaxID=74068 RepID=UPI0023E32D66|nr:uncharacterized protein LOC128985924 [Macrosteles quadrilineatus]